MKGSYIEVKGDLLKMYDDKEFDMIAHGCNCQKDMSGGIAYQIAKRYVSSFMEDCCDSRVPIERLGNMTMTGVDLFNTRRIINLYTQFMPGEDFDIAALSICLEKLNIMFKGHSIGLPQIGCGIGGGNWSDVKEVIQERLADMNVTVVIYSESK